MATKLWASEANVNLIVFIFQSMLQKKQCYVTNHNSVYRPIYPRLCVISFKQQKLTIGVIHIRQRRHVSQKADASPHFTKIQTKVSNLQVTFLLQHLFSCIAKL